VHNISNIGRVYIVFLAKGAAYPINEVLTLLTAVDELHLDPFWMFIFDNDFEVKVSRG